MSARYLYILVEESFRELRARVLVAKAALALGFEVVLGQQWWFAENLAHLPPGVTLFKGNNRVQASLMAMAAAGGHRVTSIEEEAFALQDRQAVTRLFDPRCGALCDAFLVQGERHAAYLREHLPAVGAKVRVVGNPRAEVIASDAKARGTAGSVEGMAPKGKFVLVNTNYASINPFDFDTFAYYRRCVDVGVVVPGDPVDMEMFHGWCDWERNNVRAMMDFLRGMAADQPHIPVVVRPHPSENASVWQRALASFANVTVVVDRDHVPWLRACAVLAHSGSTTGLEAFLFAREAVNICAGSSNWHDRFIAPVVNTVARSGDEAVEAVSRLMEGGNGPETWAQRSAALQPLLLTKAPVTPSRAIAAVAAEIAPSAPAAIDESRLVDPESSARRLFKAFTAEDDVRALFAQDDDGYPPIDPDIRAIGASVWLVR